MNQRAIALQFIAFLTQWGLMIIGFGILALVIAPLRIQSDPNLGRFFAAALKGIIALLLSISWLFIWDRQVRVYFYLKRDLAKEPV